MSSASTASDPSARRNIFLLVLAQALGGASGPIIVALGGLVGRDLAADPSMATLPVSAYNVGLALSTIPVALLMRRFGRRVTYILGALFSIAGALTAVQAISLGGFWLFCGAAAIMGFYTACVANYRFAASDLAPAGQQVGAISKIMLGGLLAAVIGPQVVIHGQAWLSDVPYEGGFIGQVMLAMLALPILFSLHVPKGRATNVEGDARPLTDIMRTPAFAVGALAGITSYGLMVFVMTAAPLAMVEHGHGVDDAALGIQWHVLAMFAPSFFTGKLIDRFGKIAMTSVGFVLLALSGLMALSGLELLHYWGALILLGLGWNLGFVGATAIVTQSYHPAERAKVQAANDFMIFTTVALASLGSGRMLAQAGWYDINQLSLPVCLAMLVILSGYAFRVDKGASQ